MVKSNKTYHYIFKYGLLGAATLMPATALVSWIAPESITVNGQPGTQDITTTIIFGLIGVLSFLLFLLIKDKFAIIEMGNQTIKIIHNKEERNISWLDVEEIKLIQFIYPPLYKLKEKNSEDTVWFIAESRYINLNGFVIDLSDMGDVIEKKKRELGI